MLQSFSIPPELVWPFAIAIGWVAGEFGHRWTGLPRISLYGLVGFLLASTQTGFLPKAADSNMLVLADVAFGLILFELGYRINLHWLKVNPWIAVSSVAEALGTFIVVYFISAWYGTSTMTALLLASLAMSTSPAGVLRVINEKSSSGQVTERTLHLSALNSVMAVFAFKVIIGYWLFQSSGSILKASWNSLVMLMLSALLGAVFGVLVPALRRRLGNVGTDATVGFAIGVILLVALSHVLNFSPILSALTFGLVARHRRETLSQTQRNFGVLGDLLVIPLFIFVATTLEWQQAVAGIGLGLLIIIARILTKIVGVTLFARVSGISWRKGLLTGLALSPASVFVILILEQTRYLEIDLASHLAPLAAMVLVMEVLGPILTQRALVWARETSNEEN
ncbi:cation:proton antiporter [Janthinobacterium sp. 17J80-10]|uniref:cation:proton antiporter n=1 Tax=Janthinobacterium sp. 17J80-10 TaxID=2497863 RepID=UPI00100589A5|nr:cation:proton antiporter [Janthinobacterium sp. 17J80-10]QAU35361.1 sodium:proton antiporter [Janthinobacterium sp. 17J80-10]